MRYQHHLTKLLTIATLIATPLTFAACAGHQTYATAGLLRLASPALEIVETVRLDSRYHIE